MGSGAQPQRFLWFGLRSASDLLIEIRNRCYLRDIFMGWMNPTSREEPENQVAFRQLGRQRGAFRKGSPRPDFGLRASGRRPLLVASPGRNAEGLQGPRIAVEIARASGLRLDYWVCLD